ncbi:MAG: hypothetical protein KKE77_15205 [Alphaproteobacteria bacterium]|jgi:hypothetical protein|nr:hypothetical protein [Alphaproteobacteria bacterium]
MSRVARQTTRSIFAWPLALGAATLAGLVLGLTGDGLRDVAAWTLLGLAPLVILGALLRRTPAPSPSPR